MSVELFATTAFELTVACTECAAGGFRRRRAPPGRRVRRGCSDAEHRHPCQAFRPGIVPYRDACHGNSNELRLRAEYLQRLAAHPKMQGNPCTSPLAFGSPPAFACDNSDVVSIQLKQHHKSFSVAPIQL